MSARILCTTLLLFTASAHAGDDRGLLWQVTDAEDNSAWLVGTVHAARPDFYPLPAPLEAAFETSEVLVIESDTGALSPAEIQRVTRDLGEFPRTESLRDQLPAEAWQRTREWSQRLGIPENRLLRMRPWLAAITLAALEIRREGLEPGLGMERHFLQNAGGKNTVSLESFEQQMQALAGLSESAQVNFLVESIADAQDTGASIERILTAWRSGDLADLESLLEDAYGGSDELYDALIRDRNLAWVEQIEPMIASGRTHFIAVGALHLAGPDGLVRLLSERGYRVDQISTISKSSLPAPQSGQTQFIGMSSQRVPGSIPLSGCPSDSW